MKKIIKLKKCSFCSETLIKNETNKLICPSTNCRKVGEEKKNISNNFKTSEKKEKDFSKKNQKKYYIEKLVRLDNIKIKKKFFSSRMCSSCGGIIRKNYPFGKNSKVRISGHTQRCDTRTNKRSNNNNKNRK